MENKLCFVQFNHPGPEHRPDHGLFKAWNRRDHKRKFVKQTGRYVANDKLQSGIIGLWTEWEPESTLVKKVLDPLPNGPRYVYEPFYVLPQSYRGLQNTDPFVFGQQFHYTGCRQRIPTTGRATQLRYLLPGSVILFGSSQDKCKFVLDTVFVVADWIDHDRASYKKVLGDTVSREYAEVTLRPWYQESLGENKSCITDGKTWRLYFGATRQNPLQQMFSFFPCLPFEPRSKGFARPVITLPGIITDNFYRSYKLNPQQNVEDVQSLWDQVVGQVQDQGLALGVYAQMPQRRRA